MPEDFDTYRKRSDSRRLFVGAAVVGLGAAAASPRFRVAAARAVLGGLERLGNRLGRDLYDHPYGLQTVGAQMEHLLERALPRAAQHAVATRATESALLQTFRNAGTVAERAAAQANQLVANSAFRGLMYGGRVEEFLAHTQVARVLEERVQFAKAANPNLLAHRARELEVDRIRQALSVGRAAMPNTQDLAHDPFYQQLRSRVLDRTRQHLQEQSQWERTAGAKALGFFGVRAKKLGEDPTQAALEQLLARYSHPGAAADLKLGGVYTVGGQSYDLRRLQTVVGRGRNWLQSTLQIPLVPGKDGISPFQLFPWRHGTVAKQFTHLPGYSKDPILRAVLGESGGTIGQDVFGVGGRFLAANFTDETITEVAAPGVLKSALYGFTKRRTQSVERAMAARAAGKSAGLLDWFGLSKAQLDDTRLGSIGSKFAEDSNWAPRLFRRILSAEAEAVTPEEMRRAARFLNRGELSPKLRGLLVDQVAGDFYPTLQGHVRKIEEDAHVIEFLKKAAGMQHAGVGGRFHAPELNQLVAQARAGGLESVLARYEPAERQSFFGFNLRGHADDRRGVDVVRRAITAEMEAKLTLRDGEDATLARIRKGLQGEERDHALGFLRSQQIQRRLGTRPGVFAAAEWLQGDAEAQADIERVVQQRSKWYHQFNNDPGPHLGAAELYVPQSRSFLTDFNRARAQGASFTGAFWSTVQGDWGGQYKAFFTGNQAQVTQQTLMLEHLPRGLAEKLNDVGLRLPDRDLLSGGSILSALLLKRIAPAVGAYELYRYSDYQLHQLGLPGPSEAAANVKARIGRSRAKHFGDHLPLMGRRALFPGLDKILPERTLDEEIEHQEHGYDPVKKGRFWWEGSRAEYWGEKTDYFLPSAPRLARSHWQEAENADLNSTDYWRHSWIPNPHNVLGPLSWLLDPYWWEKKHAKDRPYLVSGEAFDPQTPHGPFANAILGTLFKPRKLLHPEYVPRSMGGAASREQLRALNEGQKSGMDMIGAGLLVQGSGHRFFGRGKAADRLVGTPGVIGAGTVDEGSIAQISLGGRMTPYSLPGGFSETGLQELGRSPLQKPGHAPRLARGEIERINRQTKAGAGGLTRQRPIELLQRFQTESPLDEENLDLLNYGSGTIAGAKNLSDLWGLYGYFGRRTLSAIGRPLEQPGLTLATPSRAYGFARRWYDSNLGGLGGEINEFGRRFLTNPGKKERFNPVPNTMPGWLPGPEYFLDFRHGDPFTAVPRGEIRLPGEAYERSHEVELMHARASSLGHSVPELMQEMLHLTSPMSKHGEEVTELGKEWHEKLQLQWKRMGILISAEERIENKKLGISGHYDAILKTIDGPMVVDIKTVGNKRFQEARQHPFAENVSQVNFYLHETGINQGALLYVNRDAPDQIAWQPVARDDRNFAESVARVQSARKQLLGMVDHGQLARGDLYDPLSRFEILADVAPYSENYAHVRSYLGAQSKDGQLSEAEKARFSAAKRRVLEQKQRLHIYPYRFLHSHLKQETATVDRILSPNSFTVHGSDRAVTLAGMTSSRAGIERAYGAAPEGMSAEEWQFQQFGIRPGARVALELEADPLKAGEEWMTSPRRAVVHRGRTNVNQALIHSGAATESTRDFSDTGVAARFSHRERALGAAWEWFAHRDSPFHSKFLRVRSPLEELERGIVFGKSTGGWQNPIRDYLSPTLTSYVARNPLAAGLGLGAFAQFLLSRTQAKKVAFKYGAMVGASLSLLRIGAETFSGQTWKPVRTNRREALEQYWDALKYVKYRSLAAHEMEEAKRHEGVDLDRMSREIHAEGQMRKGYQRKLERQRRDLRAHGSKGEQAEELPEIQQRLRELAERKGMAKLGPHATAALHYQELYRGTLYGIDPDTATFGQLFRAFPKYKRELLFGFLNDSNEGERRRIYKLLPKAEQRVLGKKLGVKKGIPERPNLNRFFQDYPLPGGGWKGWRPEVDMEQLRMVAIKEEGLDPMESGFYPQQIEEAEAETKSVPVPTMKGNHEDVRAELTRLLSGRGLKNVNVSVELKPHDENHLDVQLKIRQRREREIQRALQMG